MQRDPVFLQCVSTLCVSPSYNWVELSVPCGWWCDISVQVNKRINCEHYLMWGSECLRATNQMCSLKMRECYEISIRLFLSRDLQQGETRHTQSPSRSGGKGEVWISHQISFIKKKAVDLYIHFCYIVS